MEYSQAEILQTVRMTEMEHLDIRTVTLGLSLRDCVTDSIETTAQRVQEKIERTAARLVSTVNEIGDEIGIRVANKRIAVTPVSMLTEGAKGNPVDLGRAIDQSAAKVGVDFVGGYSALIHKGFTRNESNFLDSIPEVLSTTERLCSSVNAATTRAGINMDAVARVGRLIKDAAERTRDRGGLACAKFVCFANAVEDNPFMAGAFHGVGEPEAVLNVGVSGPGVVNHAVQHADKDLPLQDLAELIKKLSFKLARAGELIGREAARRLGIPFGIIDLSLAPTPVPGDSVVGYVTQGRGISIHRSDCPNLLTLAADERRVDIDWQETAGEAFAVRLAVTGEDRRGLYADIMEAISQTGTNIRGADLHTRDGSVFGTIFVEVDNLPHLGKVMKAVRKVKGVTEIERREAPPA